MFTFSRSHLRPVLTGKDPSLPSAVLPYGVWGLEDMKKGVCGSPIPLSHGSQVSNSHHFWQRPGMSLAGTDLDCPRTAPTPSSPCSSESERRLSLLLRMPPSPVPLLAPVAKLEGRFCFLGSLPLLPGGSPEGG